MGKTKMYAYLVTYATLTPQGGYSVMGRTSLEVDEKVTVKNFDEFVLVVKEHVLKKKLTISFPDSFLINSFSLFADEEE